MGPTTNCVRVRVRVHVRAGADRATKAAGLHRLNSMMAAGRGATGSVRAADISFSLASMDKPVKKKSLFSGNSDSKLDQLKINKNFLWTTHY